MRAICLGGGPAGLYFGISMKLRNPDADITVLERNKPDDTFGWGVVFSDETLDNFAQNDPVSAAEIRKHFAYWDDMALIYKGKKTVSSGHGFCGIGRKQLLIILQTRARELGVNLQFETEVESASAYMDDYDLVVACDGLNSRTRMEFEDTFKPDIDVRKCQFVWLGTHQKFDDAFTFIFEKTDKGWVWVHAYQFDDNTATFIVECSQQTYDNFGFGEMSQQESIAICEEIFKDHLDGHSLMTNASHIRGSAWIKFPRVLCEKWHHENVVLMGDAAATAHFSIGSGTKLAMESAISLADYLQSEAASKRPSRNTKTNAASKSSAFSLPPATPWNGSRMWSGISTSTRCSSTTPCSPAPSGSATKTCAHETPNGWKVRNAGSWSSPEQELTAPSAHPCSRLSNCAT